MLLIPRPTYPPDFGFIDEDLDTVARYLFNECNTTFENLLALNGKNVINSYVIDNTASLPVSPQAYPLLKLYRTEENFIFPVGNGNSVQIVVAYVLAFSQRQKASSLTTFVSGELRRLLQNSPVDDLCPFTIDMTKGISTTYNTLTPKEDIIYSYAKTTCYLLTQ
jgi:hypothetical protein